MGKTPEQKAYKKRWRALEKYRKRHNTFITEYTRVKFENVYNEANSFFNALNAIHPQKLDLRRTKEFKGWKEAIKNAENPEACLIVQTLHTAVSYGENQTEQNYTTNNEEKQSNSDESDTETVSCNEEKQSDSDESDTETFSCNEEKQSDSDESNTETASCNDKNQSDTETVNNNDEENYHDGMLLEIPLESYLPAPRQDKNTQTTASDTELPNNYDYEVFSDQRFQQIVAELRDDPELRNIFAEPSDQEDEGVELRTLEEELEVDIEPFDYRLEVELSNWESQL